MRLRPKEFLAAAVALALIVTVPVTGAADEHVLVGELGADDEVFWDGGHVTFDPSYSMPLMPSNASLDRCEALGDPCFRFELRTTEEGARLRIGFDTPMRDDGFEVHITTPAGQVLRMTNGNQYSMEQFIPNPPVGAYLITVAPYSAEYAAFRMRAKLESVAHAPASGAGDLPPNLRVTRLWEFGFAAPLNPLNGLFPPDDLNPPMDVLGYRPMSCALDEQLGYDGEPATRCLRYSFGLANIGEGNFDVRLRSDGTMTQCVQQRDGAPPVAREAGTGSFHATHGHYHYDDIIHHTVFRVTDTTTGAMEEIGTGRKIGYSPADQGMPRWHLFTQAPRNTSGSAGDCTGGDSSYRVGMSPGWGDAYRYQRPGNFVDFSEGGDGFFVVQTTADPLGLVLESDEGDNTSYAYIRVIGEQIDLIESGLGTSPWDSLEIFEL